VGKFKVSPIILAGILVCTLSLPGCGGSSTITITLSPTTAPALNSGQTQSITATVANDSKNEGVTWSLSGPGTLSNQTTTSVTYAAPSNIVTASSATVTATSVANTTITATLSITLNAVLGIVTTSLPSGTLGTSYQGVISATGATGTFTWVLTSGTLPAGLSLSTSTAASISVQGTPTALGTSTFTMQVTDSTGNSVSQTLSITINPPPPLSVSTHSLPTGTVGTTYSGTLKAANGVAPYTWIIANGALPAGLTLTADSGLISGTPTAVGMSSFTVQVTDSTTPTPQAATANLSITVNPSTVGDARLNGSYAFLVSGFDGSNRFVAAGSFTADGNGNISNGVMDSNEYGSAPQLQQTFTGTYLIGTNGLGTLSFTTSPARSFSVSMMADGNAKIIEFDDVTGNGTRDSGVLLLQTPTAFSTSSITGGYAFGLLGVDALAGRYGFVGEFAADGNGNFTNGSLDSDDATAGASGAKSCTGTYSIPSATPPSGRGTATISISGGGTTNYSFYVVNATELLVMETDSISGQNSPVVGGTMLQQSGAGSFGQSSLNGSTVFETTALPSVSSVLTPQGQVGLLTFASPNLTMASDVNTGGTLTTGANLSGATYTVASSGRVTMTNSGIASPDPILYLVSQNQAFLVGTDAAVTFGFLENQSGEPFTAASLSGTYAGGSLAPIVPAASDQVDIGIADGVSNLALTTDASTSSGLFQNQTTTASYTVAPSSRGTLTVNGTQTGVIYVVSPTEFVRLGADTNAMVENFQQ